MPAWLPTQVKPPQQQILATSSGKGSQEHKVTPVGLWLAVPSLTGIICQGLTTVDSAGCCNRIHQQPQAWQPMYQGQGLQQHEMVTEIGLGTWLQPGSKVQVQGLSPGSYRDQAEQR